ncbi:MAG TPA: MYXO-CTERM sorting domain-containing protein [Nannocystaceae bacterium]|nr:MYXO-CTERM sorting domain-containing protein [Nannocystaceae bacterium]
MACARIGSKLAVVLATMAVPQAAHAVQRTVYLNLDSTPLVNTGNDPTMNAFSTGNFTGGTIDGWGALSDDEREELLWWFKEAAVPFNIVFTYDRPAAGPYDMLVFGSSSDPSELFSDVDCPTVALGLADCNDTQGGNISFMFYGCLSAAQQSEMSRIAFNGLTGLGFGWGLENLTSSGQIMAGYNSNGVEFGDECTPINGTSMCTHSGCAAMQQNSTSDLNAVIGARVDDGPPVLEITSPPNMSVTAADVTVEATVTDLFGGLTVSLEIVEAAQMLDDARPPYSWDLTGIPDGEWTLRVTAIDADMNMVQQEVLICVGQNDCPSTSADSSSSGGETSSSGGETSSSGGEETSTGEDSTSTGGDTGTIPPVTTAPSDTAGFDRGGAETGCGCSNERDHDGWLALLVLGVIARRRRR